jgi:hypothetical protein
MLNYYELFKWVLQLTSANVIQDGWPGVYIVISYG